MLCSSDGQSQIGTILYILLLLFFHHCVYLFYFYTLDVFAVGAGSCLEDLNLAKNSGCCTSNETCCTSGGCCCDQRCYEFGDCCLDIWLLNCPAEEDQPTIPSDICKTVVYMSNI